MDSLADTAAQVLGQSPDPALTVDELLDRMRSGLPDRRPGREELIRALGTDPNRFRVLLRPARSWPVEIGPDAWLVATGARRAQGRPGRSVLGRLRAAVVTLGQEVEPGSMQSWARWHGLVDSERRARAALQGAERRDENATSDSAITESGTSTIH